MMPRCYYHKCKKTGMEYFGKVWNGEVFPSGERECNPVYLCPKHAKKMRSILGISFEEVEQQKGYN